MLSRWNTRVVIGAEQDRIAMVDQWINAHLDLSAGKISWQIKHL